MRDEVKERVARGGEWLDTQKPGWYYLIDLSGLDLGCGKDCILGQLYASEAMESCWSHGFSYALGMLLDDGPSCIYGFTISHSDLQFNGSTAKAYAALDEAWIEYIKERINA